MSVEIVRNYFKEHKDSWQDVNLKKIPVYFFTKDTQEHYFASRKLLDDTFKQDSIKESITDTGIQTILLKHLKNQWKNFQKCILDQLVIMEHCY